MYTKVIIKRKITINLTENNKCSDRREGNEIKENYGCKINQRQRGHRLKINILQLLRHLSES